MSATRIVPLRRTSTHDRYQAAIAAPAAGTLERSERHFNLDLIQPSERRPSRPPLIREPNRFWPEPRDFGITWVLAAILLAEVAVLAYQIWGRR